MKTTLEYDLSIQKITNTLVVGYRWYEKVLAVKANIAYSLGVPLDLLKIVPDKYLTDVSFFLDKNGTITHIFMK